MGALVYALLFALRAYAHFIRSYMLHIVMMYCVLRKFYTQTGCGKKATTRGNYDR